jgi:integrase
LPIEATFFQVFSHYTWSDLKGAGQYQDWKKTRDKIPGAGQNLYLFVSQMSLKGRRRGQPEHLAHDQLYRRFKKYLVLAGLPPKFHPHALRHSCGVILASKGYSAFDIQRCLGHASLSSTLCYVDLKGKEELEPNRPPRRLPDI